MKIGYVCNVIFEIAVGDRRVITIIYFMSSAKHYYILEKVGTVSHPNIFAPLLSFSLKDNYIEYPM